MDLGIHPTELISQNDDHNGETPEDITTVKSLCTCQGVVLYMVIESQLLFVLVNRAVWIVT